MAGESWNPKGVLGAAMSLNKPGKSLDLLLSPEEHATVDFKAPAKTDAPEDGRACPSPGAMQVYRLGSEIGELGGHMAGYSGGLRWAAGGAANPAGAAARLAAGTVGKDIAVPTALAGSGMQMGAGLAIGLETSNWNPLKAAGVPAVAGLVAELQWFGEPVADSLQKYIESHGPNYKDCLPSGR